MLSPFSWRRVKAFFSGGGVTLRAPGWYAHTGIKEEAYLGGSGALSKLIENGDVRIYVKKAKWEAFVRKFRGKPEKDEKLSPKEQKKKQRAAEEQRRKQLEAQRNEVEKRRKDVEMARQREIFERRKKQAEAEKERMKRLAKEQAKLKEKMKKAS